MTFGIEFTTNAKKTTKDIKELDKATQELDKSQEKHNLTGVDKLNTTKKQIKLDRQEKAEQDKIARQKKEEARLQKEQQKAEEKAQKERAKEFYRRKKQVETEYKLKKFLDKQDKERLNTAKQLSNLALGVVSAGGVLKFLSNAFNAGREYSNSALTTNFDEKYLSTLAFSVKKYGGDLKSVTSDLQSWQTRLYTLQRNGMSDAVMQNVMMKFPQEFQKIFYGKDNRLVTDTKTILENIAKAMLGMSKEEAQLLGQELGISQSLVLLLRESGGDLAKVLEANKKQAEMDAETAKELQKAKEAFDKIEQEFKKNFISMAGGIAKVIDYFPSWWTKLFADIGTIIILLGTLKAIDNLLKKFPVVLGKAGTTALGKVAPKIVATLSMAELLAVPALTQGLVIGNSIAKKQQAIEKDKRERENLLIYGNNLGLNTGWDINNGFDYLNAFNTATHTPLNSSTPQQLFGGGSQTINNVNITNNTEINGVNTSDAKAIENSVIQGTSNTLTPILQATGSDLLN